MNRLLLLLILIPTLCFAGQGMGPGPGVKGYSGGGGTTWIYSATNTTTPGTYTGGTEELGIWRSAKCAIITPPTTQTFTKISPYIVSVSNATECKVSIWDQYMSSNVLIQTFAPTTGYNDVTVTGTSLTGSTPYGICVICNGDGSGGYSTINYNASTLGRYCGTSAGLATSYTGFVTDCPANVGSDASMQIQMRIGY